MLRHIQIGDIPYSCEFETCQKVFIQKCDFTKHMLIHTRDKPYMRDTFGMSFSRKSSLFRHIIVHTGKQPYVCETCGKLVTRKGDLIKDIPFYAGDKPYKCGF